MKPTGHPQIDSSTDEWIVGSDEAGFGSWAGPLTVAAVALPRTWYDPDVNDSKKFSSDSAKSLRDQLFKKYTTQQPVMFHLVAVSNDEIDRVGMSKVIHQAHRKALETVIQKLGRPCLKIVDGYKDGTKLIGLPGLIGLPKADSLIPAVSLASIIAKVAHDIMMRQFDTKYPGYGFGQHVGYGTAQHDLALKRLGPCPIHRKSYGPVAKVLRSGVDTQLREAWEDLD
jgi:ribonuclease HII